MKRVRRVKKKSTWPNTYPRLADGTGLAQCGASVRALTWCLLACSCLAVSSIGNHCKHSVGGAVVGNAEQCHTGRMKPGVH